MNRAAKVNNMENAAAAKGVTTTLKGLGKRKAEMSPTKKSNKKRSALGDLTNAVKKKAFKAKGGKVAPEKAEKQAVDIEVNEEPAQPRLTRAKSKSTSSSSSSTSSEPEVITLSGDSDKSGEGTPDGERRKTRSMTKPIVKSISTVDLTAESPEKKDPKGGKVKKGPRVSSGSKIDDNSLYTTAISSPEPDSNSNETTQVIEENAKNDAKTLVLKAKLPEGVVDFDEETGNDPYQVPEYAQEIFDYYRRREVRFPVSKYLDSIQTETNRNMRAILVDWMVEVQESFELNHETLYLAVKMLDLYLGLAFVKRDRLQLIGTTALYVASKYDERCPPAIDDFCYICDDAYPQKEIIKMEMQLLKTLGYDIGFPLSYRFLRRFARCAKLDMELLTLARYILEVSLMEYDLIDTRDSMMAGAVLLLALKIKEIPEPWSPTLVHYSGYTQEELFDLTHRLYQMIRNIPAHLKTIRNKYSHKVFYEVAKIPLPELSF